MGKGLTIGIVLGFLIACTTAASIKDTALFCEIAKPIYPTTNDVKVMSAKLARSIDNHDNNGHVICGWQFVNK